MSAEVAKKRGRPKKVISDPVEVEVLETAKKATTRAKSTKTAAKGVKAAPATPAKATVVKKSVSKAAEIPVVSKIATKSSAPSAKPVEKAIVAKPTPTSPTTSKILEQVKELEAKKGNVTQESAKGTAPTDGKLKGESTPESAKMVERSQQQSSTKPSTISSKPQPTMATKPTPPSSQPKPFPSPISPNPKAPTKASPPPPPPSKSTPPPPPHSAAKPTPKPPHVPIAELNSAIVSNIAARAGARPNTAGSQQLPKNYRPVARKVTMAIVALPIAIVTSYVLYQRLVLGEEKKLFPMPKQMMGVDTETKIELSSSGSNSTPASSQ
ncbi:hypothetical protein ONS95_006307 [Cadophora gregata]|uniref:uncharacterized protein n=1 Tax=Cadophora gregata TaxID=51156 RepID=UPI0026DCE8B3|nr:uncharacterized protein ONS95_006307 [Cadophora gregata]KAK0102705.1 hypothetical protein ONS95_006307 [Cadophora gregata]